MSRDPELLLDDIVQRCRSINRIAGSLSEEEFVSNEIVYEAVLRHLTIIGEAVKGLTPEIKDSKPEVDWRQIARLRDLLVHVYFGVVPEKIYQLVIGHVPALEAACVEVLKNRFGR